MTIKIDNNLGSLGLEREPKILVQTEMGDLSRSIRIQANRFLQESPEGKRIESKLRSNAEIARPRMLPSGPKSGGRINFQDYAIWYVWYANEHTEAEADKALDRFFDNDEFNGLLSIWVRGIFVEEPLHLSNGVSIVPLEAMPVSSDRERFRNQVGDFGFDHPACALVKQVSMSKTKGPASAHGPKPYVDENFKKVFDEIVHTCSLLNLLDSTVCAPALQSFYPIGCPSLSPFGGGGLLFSHQQYFENYSVINSERCVEIDTLLKAWGNLESNQQILLQRVNRPGFTGGHFV